MIQEKYLVTSVNRNGAPASQPSVDPAEAIPICSNWVPGIDNGAPESIWQILGPIQITPPLKWFSAYTVVFPKSQKNRISRGPPVPED